VSDIQIDGASENDVREIADIVLLRDTEAFCRADWDAVADDFDAERFLGLDGRGGAAAWTIGYADLDSYRELWLAEAKRLLDGVPPETLSKQLTDASRIVEIQVRGHWALVRKEFDGWAGADDERERLLWRTYYQLRHDGLRWRITGFVGFLPLDERTTDGA